MILTQQQFLTSVALWNEKPRKLIFADRSICKLESSSALIILMKIIQIESSAIINLRGVSTKLN